MELSNKALAVLLVASIVVSFGGITISMNRLGSLRYVTALAASDTGAASINITSNINILFTNDTVNFGTGYMNGTGGQFCRLETNDTAFDDGADSPTTCFGFNSTMGQSPSPLRPFTIENQGNQNVSLNLTVTQNNTAALFIGGTGAEFNYFVASAEAGSCSSANLDPEVWTPINSSSWTVCGGTGFNFNPTSNSIYLHLQVRIPGDATPGMKNVTFTATGY